MALIGLGTSENPFLVSNADDVRELFTDLRNTNVYELTNSIDMTEEPNLPGLYCNNYPNAGPTIRGNGYSIYGMRLNNLTDKYWIEGSSITFEDIHLSIDECQYLIMLCIQLHLINVRIDFNGSGEMGVCQHYQRGFQFLVNSLLLTVPGGKLTKVFNNREGRGSIQNCYLYSSEASSDTWGCNIVTEPFVAASYAGLPESDWSKVDGIYPQLIPTVKDYSHYTHVAGTTLLDGAGYSRRVRVLNQANNGLIGDVMTEADGTFDLDTTPHQNAVLVMAYDDVGTRLKADTAYSLDGIVFPYPANGYRYLCIQAGTTDAALPAPPLPTDQLTSGTAIFEAQKIRQPIVHGPMAPAPAVPPAE